MICRTLILLLASLSLAPAASPVRSPEKLRSLTMLPTMSASLQIKSEELHHPELALRTNELAQRIVSLRQQMQKAPSDAERYVLIGTYCEALEQAAEAAAAFSNAVSLFRVRAENRPQDGLLQARFASALIETGAAAEAERVLRATIRAVPEDWSCWAGLGDYLDGKARLVLFGGTNNLAADTPPSQMLSELARRSRTPPTAAEVEEANGYLAEAEKCFDRAVALGAKDSAAHLARALHRSWNLMCRQFLVRQFRGQPKIETEEMLATLSSPEACADWANAARLPHTNYLIIANWGWLEALPAIISSQSKREGSPPLNALPESRRRNVLEAMRRLEAFSENQAPRSAAGALESLGILRFMVSGETARAKTDFRQAVTLDSLRPQAWEGLMCLAIVDGDSDELVAVCEERLKYIDTAKNRVAAAKACLRAGQEDKALSYARTAVKAEPASALARVCLGALLLRRPLDEASGQEVLIQFNRVLELAKTNDDEEHQELVIVAGVNWAIYCILDGNVEQARSMLASMEHKAAATDEIKERIKEIRTMLGD